MSNSLSEILLPTCTEKEIGPNFEDLTLLQLTGRPIAAVWDIAKLIIIKSPKQSATRIQVD